MAQVTAEQYVSLHSRTGTQLYQFTPSQYVDLSWTRDQRAASRLDINVPPEAGGVIDRIADIAPWAHWMTVWDGDRDVILWTGPIQKVKANRLGMSINAKDHAAYLTRTRVPTTKRWDASDPAWIAGQLWDLMLDQKGLAVRTIIRTDPEGHRYDFYTETDSDTLDQTMGDLVNLGLKWTVVSGVPIVGPPGILPITTLGEADFLGDGVDLVRDGAATYNDMIVRGSDTLTRAQRGYLGEVLQGVKNIDSMSGVSNVNRAAQQYVRQTAMIRTRMELPTGTVLHPDAPVSIDELIPGTRFIVQAYGIRQLMELTSVEVARRAGAVETKVTMEQALTTEEKIDLELDQRPENPDKQQGGGAASR